MRVSVVIPTYNGEKYLAQTIESVLAQTLRDWELIIVDDGSQDNSPGIACDYAREEPRIRVVRQSNQGIAGARNRGLAESRPDAEFVAYLDHDDLWMPDALEAMVAAAERCPG